MTTDKLDLTLDELCTNDTLVKVVGMGNVTEILHMQHRNTKPTIKMLEGGDRYVNLATGEILPIQKHNTRADQRNSLYRTFQNARALINANVTNVEYVRWCTLTYRENMTDTKRLYEDFKNFWKRFLYYCKKKGYSKPEYIVMMEPQGRGAWHAHLLIIWQDMKAPYIPNEEFAELWQQGFVKIKKLDDVDNVGAYLTAYLGDMEIQDVNVLSNTQYKLKEVEIEENGQKVKKSYIKGARLELYPANFNMIRHSKGIKQPTEEYMAYGDAKKKVLGATKTFENTVQISDDENGFSNIVSKAYYNSTRKEKQ